MTLRRGDFVSLRCGDKAIDAMVLLASGNGRSLMVGFSGIIDGHVGSMPLLQDEHGAFRSIVTQQLVQLERRQ